MMETLVIIKPDAVKKKLIGKIIGIYEENGLRIADMYMCTANQEILEEHYEEHKGRDFYDSLMEFMQSGPIVVMKVIGENAVEIVRSVNGATNPAKSRPCTIRYKYGKTVQKNAVHGSASAQEALREIDIWFNE